MEGGAPTVRVLHGIRNEPYMRALASAENTQLLRLEGAFLGEQYHQGF